jgi:ABC-2 type transport system ATP-binding protein
MPVIGQRGTLGITRYTRRPVDAAIRALGLTKRFGSKTAVEDVSFDVPSGQVFGFLGPNGAGKTTTVRVLATLIRPTAGAAEVAGVAVSEESAVELRSRVAVMTEAPGLYLRLTVFDNLEYFAGLYGIAPHAVRGRILASLDAVGLADRHGDRAGSLSKGLRQRVSLARALLPEPRVLFLDEPTSGLDPVATREVRELIDGLRHRGVTVFLTTHRLEEAERLCDRIAILNTTLRIVGAPDELRRQLFSPALEISTTHPLADPVVIFGAIPQVETWQALGDSSYRVNVADPRASAPDVARAIVSSGAGLVRLSEASHSLEDVYLQLVNEDVEAER